MQQEDQNPQPQQKQNKTSKRTSKAITLNNPADLQSTSLKLVTPICEKHVAGKHKF